MDLEALIEDFRSKADDRVGPPFLFPDEDVMTWLNEAQHEAAVRRRLIREASNPAICAIAVSAGNGDCALHPSVFEITYQAFRADGAMVRTPIALVTREWLDRNVRDWRDADGPEPRYLVQDGLSLRIVPTPTVNGTLFIEGYRTPLASMENDADTPEIADAHHRHLVQWALFRGFSVPDKEVFDPDRAARAEAEFSRYFGLRPDADLRSDTRMDVSHHNEAIWP